MRLSQMKCMRDYLFDVHVVHLQNYIDMFPAINMMPVEDMEGKIITSFDDDITDTMTYGIMPRQAWLYR